MPARDPSIPVWKHLLGGGLAGAIEISIMYPTEFVKTYMQLQKKTAGKMQFANSLDCGRYFVREKGFFSLYRGITSLIVGTAPKTSLRFTVFGKLKEALRDEQGKLSMFRTWLAGAMTGFVEATAVVTPVETMKTVMVADTNSAKPRFTGLGNAVTTIVREQGIGGIYKGVVPTIAKQMGNQSIRFTTYETLKKLLRNRNAGKPVPAWQMMLCGGTAGFISVILTQPFDMVKSRMQAPGASAEYSSTVDCVGKVLRQEGVFAFWKGTAARIPRVAVGQSITLAGYDQIMLLINKVF